MSQKRMDEGCGCESTFIAGEPAEIDENEKNAHDDGSSGQQPPRTVILPNALLGLVMQIVGQHQHDRQAATPTRKVNWAI